MTGIETAARPHRFLIATTRMAMPATSTAMPTPRHSSRT